LENKKVVNLKNRMASILETYTPNMNQMINEKIAKANKEGNIGASNVGVTISRQVTSK